MRTSIIRTTIIALALVAAITGLSVAADNQEATPPAPQVTLAVESTETSVPQTAATGTTQAAISLDSSNFAAIGQLSSKAGATRNYCTQECRNTRVACLISCPISDPDCFVGCWYAYLDCMEDCAS